MIEYLRYGLPQIYWNWCFLKSEVGSRKTEVNTPWW